MNRPDAATTEDRLLGGRVMFRQPAQGYRAAIDPVLLAAAVPARARDRVLDLGAGAGAASLCLAARIDGVDVTGLEIDPDLAALFGANAAANGWASRLRCVVGDVAEPPRAPAPEGFDIVMANPPYLPGEAGTPSPHEGKRRAHGGGPPLERWIAAALRYAKPNGRLVFIHRADRLDALLAALHGRAGAVEILPIWPRRGEAATRVVVRARKGARTPATLLPGLVLHDTDAKYAAEADAVLRGGAMD